MKDAHGARKLFGNKCASLHAMLVPIGQLLESMAPVARMIDEHLNGIFTNSTRSLTTAFIGGLNTLFSTVKLWGARTSVG
jgi:hypothetical protein